MEGRRWGKGGKDLAQCPCSPTLHYPRIGTAHPEHQPHQQGLSTACTFCPPPRRHRAPRRSGKKEKGAECLADCRKEKRAARRRRGRGEGSGRKWARNANAEPQPPLDGGDGLRGNKMESGNVRDANKRGWCCQRGTNCPSAHTTRLQGQFFLGRRQSSGVAAFEGVFPSFIRSPYSPVVTQRKEMQQKMADDGKDEGARCR
jgi:hypothetical protein